MYVCKPMFSFLCVSSGQTLASVVTPLVILIFWWFLVLVHAAC